MGTSNGKTEAFETFILAFPFIYPFHGLNYCILKLKNFSINYLF